MVFVCDLCNKAQIDLSDNDPELTSLTKKMYEFCSARDLEKSEQVFYNDIVKKFDQDTIINQSITTSFAMSPYSIMASIAKGKDDIGNFNYRANKQSKLLTLSLKTFIIGKMSIDCYYRFKSYQIAESNDLNVKFVKPKHAEMTKYDLTQLTRSRTANLTLSSDRATRNKALYFAIQAWQHMSDNREYSGFNMAIMRSLVFLKGFTDPFFQDMCKQCIELESKNKDMISLFGMSAPFILALNAVLRHNLDEAVDIVEKCLTSHNNNFTVVKNACAFYGNWIQKQFHNMVNDESKCKITEKEIISKLLSLIEKSINFISKGKFLSIDKSIINVEIMYIYSPDIETNKKTQSTVLKLYQNIIKRDQNLGLDIINNWTRTRKGNYNKFPNELIEIIIRYWYLPSNEKMINVILNCVDLVETYFKNDNKKRDNSILMKQTKALSNIISKCGNIQHKYQTETTTGDRTLVCISMRNPGKFERYQYRLRCGQIPTLLDWSEFGTLMGSWQVDKGLSGNNNEHDELQSKSIAISRKYMIKLAYFYAFMMKNEDLIVNKLETTLNMIKNLRVFVIKLILHFRFLLVKYEYKNFKEMITDSSYFLRLAQIVSLKTQESMESIARICDNISNVVNLDTKASIKKIWNILTPYVTTKDNKLCVFFYCIV